MFVAGDDWRNCVFCYKYYYYYYITFVFQVEKDCKPIEELVKDPKPLPREVESIIQLLWNRKRFASKLVIFQPKHFLYCVCIDMLNANSPLY